jgi:uncharacterized protein YpmB
VKKWFLISGFIIVVIIGLVLAVYLSAVDPLKKAEKIAVDIAEKETSLVTVKDFSLYNGSKTYYVVRGTNRKGTDLIVWIPEEEKNRKIVVKNAKYGVSEKEAVQKLYDEKHPQEIISVKLGMENNIPLWEIYYRSDDDLINYYYVDFESGEWLKNIQNL